MSSRRSRGADERRAARPQRGTSQLENLGRSPPDANGSEEETGGRRRHSRKAAEAGRKRRREVDESDADDAEEEEEEEDDDDDEEEEEEDGAENDDDDGSTDERRPRFRRLQQRGAKSSRRQQSPAEGDYEDRYPKRDREAAKRDPYRPPASTRAPRVTRAPVESASASPAEDEEAEINDDDEDDDDDDDDDEDDEEEDDEGVRPPRVTRNRARFAEDDGQRYPLRDRGQHRREVRGGDKIRLDALDFRFVDDRCARRARAPPTTRAGDECHGHDAEPGLGALGARRRRGLQSARGAPRGARFHGRGRRRRRRRRGLRGL